MSLSKDLGFKFNQMYRFEGGIVRLSWSDFISICNCCGIDLKNAFNPFLDQRLKTLDVAQIVQTLIAKNDVGMAAKQIQRPKRTVQRWLSGESEPDFQEGRDLKQLTCERDDRPMDGAFTRLTADKGDDGRYTIAVRKIYIGENNQEVDTTETLGSAFKRI